MARKPSSTAEVKPNAEIQSIAEEAEINHNVQANMSENPSPASVDDASYSLSRCGGVLKTEREKQGLSVHDVASKLKISGRQIESIEADQFALLPEATIVRGFIRNYAKLLKIQAEPLLDAYSVLVPTKEPLAFMLKPSSTMKVGGYKKPKTARYVTVALLLLLALGAWFFYQSYIQKPSPTLPTEDAETIEALPQPALPAAERQEQSIDLTLPAPEATDVAPAETTVNPASSSEITPAAANVALDNTLAPSSSLVEAKPADANIAEANPFEPDAGMAKLEFNANQETWISVVDANGKQLYNKTIFAGSRESFNAKPPINVVIGNASGVAMNINNKPLNLGPHTRSNVARVKVDKLELNQFE